MLLEHIYKKFEINRTLIKGGCQSESKVVTPDSKSDLPLASLAVCLFTWQKNGWWGEFSINWMVVGRHHHDAEAVDEAEAEEIQ